MTSLAALALSWLLAGPAAGAPGEDADCRGGDIPIALLVAASEFRADIKSYAILLSWFRPPQGVPYAEAWIRDVADLPTAMMIQAQGCRRIRYLTLYGRGFSGFLAFSADSQLDVSSAGAKLEGLDKLMAPDARVELAGGEAVRGDRGEDLLLAVAKYLLPGGGRVRGWTRVASTSLVALSGDGRLAEQSKELVVEPGLKKVRWNGAEEQPRSWESRIRSFKRGLEFLARAEKALARCRIPDDARRGITLARAALAAAQKDVEGIARDRLGLSAANEKAWVSNFLAWRDYYDIHDRLAGENPCKAFGEDTREYLSPEGPALLIDGG